MAPLRSRKGSTAEILASPSCYRSQLKIADQVCPLTDRDRQPTHDLSVSAHGDPSVNGLRRVNG